MTATHQEELILKLPPFADPCVSEPTRVAPTRGTYARSQGACVTAMGISSPEGKFFVAAYL
jgi:hypothetical protein